MTKENNNEQMTAEEYRQRMMQAFHNADCGELIAVCVLPTEKEFEHLEWLLKNHYKKEPCEDCISRDKAIVQLNHLLSNIDDEGNLAIRKCIETIKSMSPVTPQPKMGQWIEHYDVIGKWYECDQCHTDWGGHVNYCPNCGAKM